MRCASTATQDRTALPLTKTMTGSLERALLLVTLQSPSTIKSSYKSQLSRSRSRMSTKLETRAQSKEKRVGRLLNNTNRDEMDEFFREPSPHELAISSEISDAERRVAEVMADLTRKTSEQLDSWSMSLDSTLDSTKEFQIEPIDQALNQAIFHQGDMVSSPVSCLQDTALPNMASVSPAAGQVSVSPKHEMFTSTNTFTLSDKPTFQSFLRRVGKTPPPQIVVRDFAYAGNTTAVPLSSHIKSNTGRLRHERAGTVAVAPAQKPTTKSSDAMSESGKSVVPEKTSAPLSNINTQKPLPPIPSAARPRLPRSASSPLLGAQPGITRASITKRKPLPKDSPLLIPLSEHPAFINISPARARRKDEVSSRENLAPIEDGGKEDKLDESVVLLPSPPSPSLRSCVGKRTRLLR